MLRRHTLVVVTLALAAVASVPAPTGAECFDYSTLFRPLGSAALPMGGTDVAVAGDYAFVIAGEYDVPTFLVYDISAAHGSGGAIELVASLLLPADANGIAVTSDHAYVATRTGLLTIDIGDPAEPVILGMAGATANDVTVLGELALATSYYGFDVYSLVDPSAPEPIGHAVLPECFELGAAGDYAYLAGGPGMVVVDISDPTQPTLVTMLPLAFPMYGLALGEGYAFVTGGVRWQIETQGWFYAVDVRQPATPQLVATLDFGMVPGVSVAWQADVAYVSQETDVLGGYTGQLTLVDVREPSVPRVMREVGLPDQGRGVCVAGGQLLLTSQDMSSGGGVLRAYRAAVLPGPILGRVPTPGSARVIEAQGEMAYLVYEGGTAVLRIVDVSCPLQPVPHGMLPFANSGAMSLVAHGDYAYLGFQTAGLHVIDIANPDAPATVATFPLILYIWRMRARGNQLYVMQNSTGLTILDISTPASPVIQGSVAVPGYNYDFALSGDHAFIASVTSFEVVNVHDPTAPYPVGSLAIPAWAIEVAGDFAFVLDDYGNVRVVDISDPTQPVPVAFLDNTSYAATIAIGGETAYLGTTTGLAAIDISDPYAPCEIGEESTMSLNAEQVTCNPGAVLLADGEAGLVLLARHCAAAAMDPAPTAAGLSLRVSPNPLRDRVAIAYELPPEVSAEVGVYDLAGRRIVPLADRPVAGLRTLTWDGRDAQGAPAPSGIYWIRVRAADRAGARRVVKLAP